MPQGKAWSPLSGGAVPLFTRRLSLGKKGNLGKSAPLGHVKLQSHLSDSDRCEIQLDTVDTAGGGPFGTGAARHPDFNVGLWGGAVRPLATLKSGVAGERPHGLGGAEPNHRQIRGKSEAKQRQNRGKLPGIGFRARREKKVEEEGRVPSVYDTALVGKRSNRCFASVLPLFCL